MPVKRVSAALISVFLLMLPWPARAWWSFEKGGIPLSAHRNIANRAMDMVIDTDEYEDLKKFRSVVLEATTGDANDAGAHGKILVGDSRYPLANEAGRFNGGPFQEWQVRLDEKYRQGRLLNAVEGEGAYYYIGLMTHLLQDQAVPAHAANIYHGQIIGDEGCFSVLFNTSIPCDPDDLEMYSAGMDPGFITSGKNFGNKIDHYYYNGNNQSRSIVRQTQDKLTKWAYPETGGEKNWIGKQYWLPSSDTYSGEGFKGDLSNLRPTGGWGTYGGDRGEDMYLYSTIWSPLGETASPGITSDQLKEAAEYTAGMLMAVSKSLPPIVKDLSISNSNVVVGRPNSITFTILENRTPAATVYITVDDAGADSPGVAIISKEYQVGVNMAPQLDYISTAGQLPYAHTYTVDWDGKMYNTELKSGAHKLYVRAGDKDGNRSDPVNVDFYLDTGGPQVSLGSQISTIFVAFQGKPLAAPACTNPYAIDGLNLGLAVEDNTSGIKKIELSKIGGTAVYSRSFDTPVHQHIEPVLPAMADGEYLLKAEDVDGNITEAPFKLGTIETPTDIPSSAVTYDSAGEKFNVSLKVKVKSPFTLYKAELLDKDEIPLETRGLVGLESPQTFALQGVVPSEQSSIPEERRYVRVQDVSGQTLAQYKIFNSAGKDVPVSGTVREKSSNVMDMTGLGLLPGGATPKSVVQVPYYLAPRENLSGVITGELPPDIHVSLYVQTGDTPQALGGESLMAFWSDFYRVLSAGTIVPDGCDGAGTQLSQQTRVLCHSSAVNAIPLKRYVKLRAIGTQEQPVGITACYEYDPDNQNLCLKGSKYPELSISDTLWGVVRGVLHGDSMARMSAAPGTILQKGQNVAVKISDILTLTFQNVTENGYLSASFITPQSYPGTIPLASFSLGLPSGQYAENIIYNVKYPQVLSEEQQAGILVFQDIFDAATGVHALRPVSAQPNSGAGVVSFVADSLGTYLVTAPAYTAPFVVESSADNPECTITSNISGLESRIITPGSAEAQSVFELHAARNLFAAGNVVYIGPDDTAFDPPAAVKMRYSDADLSARGILEDTLALYEFSADAKVFMKLPGQVFDKERNELAAEVPHLYSMFAVLGSSRGVPIPLAEDRTPPATYAVAEVPPHRSGENVYISTDTGLYLDAYDAKVAGAATSGLKETEYALDLVEGQPEEPVLYGGPINLTEGYHTVSFRSVDNAGNEETGKTEKFWADGTAPVSTCAVAGEGAELNGDMSLMEGSSVTLAAVDPESNGISSGLGMIVFDVSTSPCASFTDFPAIAGDCRKLMYTEPFSLPVGTHTIYYSALDNVGNRAKIKTIRIDVKKIKRVSLRADGKTFNSINWGWELFPGATAYQVTSGVGEVLSPVLPAVSTGYVQAGLFPNMVYSGRLVAYTAEGSFKSPVSTAVTLANIPLSAESFLSGQNASVAIGQPDLYSKLSGAGPNRLSEPHGITLDPVGNLWVVDANNSRVLRFSPPFETNMGADLVIGQSDMYLGLPPTYRTAYDLRYPQSITFDKNGKMWVADGKDFNRVLRFSPPFISGMSADLVIGAADFSSWFGGAITAKRLCASYFGVGSDSAGNLWLADSGCNRILRFSAPFSNGMSADLVIGQQNFTDSGAAWPPNQSGFTRPTGVAFDAEDNLWVADFFNDRVLKFEAPLSTGKNASLVIGQADFNASSYFGGATQPLRNSLYMPTAADFDGQGNLYVADYGNRRILQYKPQFSNGMDAELVIGQPNFNSQAAGTGPASIGGPVWDVEVSGFVYTDPRGRMWVSDSVNNRVLLFDPGRNQTFSSIGNSSFTLRWDSAFNSAQTVYIAEISPVSDFSSGVAGSGEISALSYTFTGLSGGKKYYARVKAKNLDGAETPPLVLGYIQTAPSPAGAPSGIALSSAAIMWGWSVPEQTVRYQVFSATGGALSGLLATGATWYLQAGLLPNTTYSCVVRAINENGSSDSPLGSAVTNAAIPGLLPFLVSGQSADYVLGQTNFTSAYSGRTQSAMGNVSAVAQDNDGKTWMVDETNCRVLRFSQPVSSGMNADLVIGRPDFTSGGCGAGRSSLNYPKGIAFDGDGRLWISDGGNNRVLMYAPPFSNGMEADMVLGQADFLASDYANEENRMFTPWGLVFDSQNNLWVADSGNSRILKFSPPFRSGMASAAVIGRYSVSPAQDSLSTPFGLALDGEGNLWVADGENSRVLKFSSPLSGGMAASMVIGQPDFATRWCTSGSGKVMCVSRGLGFDQGGNLYVSDENNHRVLIFMAPLSTAMSASIVLGQPTLSATGGATAANRLSYPRGVIAGKDGNIWVADSNNKRVLAFRKRPYSDIGPESLRLAWDASANPTGTVYQAEISSAADFSAGTVMSGWAAASSLGISGLVPDTVYYGRVRAKSFAGIETPPQYLGTARTIGLPRVYARSTGTVGEIPEVSLSSLEQMSIAPVAFDSDAAKIAVASASVQNLVVLSSIYNIGPEKTYDPPAILTFYYSPAAVAAAQVPETELAVYEYFSDRGWVRLDGQVLDVAANKITVPITRVASLFGIFVVNEDRLAPVSRLEVEGPAHVSQGKLYLGTASGVKLSADDPVVLGTASGVAFTEFRIDAGTSSAFTTYTSPFTLPAGEHSLEFRSADLAGNFEATKSTMVFVDGEAPVVDFSLAGASYAANGSIYAAAGSTITLTASDTGSGGSALQYVVNGSTESAGSSAGIMLAHPGVNAFRYFAVDNVGNAGVEQSLSVIVDTSAPKTSLALVGEMGRNGWHVSGVEVSLGATDELSGVGRTLCRLDGGTLAVYLSSFTLLAEGIHELSAYSMDNVLNKEQAGTFPVKIDVSTPGIRYEFQPAANALGWNNGPVRVAFSGEDLVSGIDHCSSSFTIVGEGAQLPVSGYCQDFAGWSSTATFTVSIDTTLPAISYVTAPAPNAAGWNNSDVTIKFTCFDGLSGIKTCPADVAIEGEGVGISTSVAAVDNADNLGIALVSGLKVDRTPPVSTATLSGALGGGWYSSDVGIVLSAKDSVSGIKRIFYSLDNTEETEYAGALSVVSEGIHNLKYYSEDLAGNKEAAKEIVFAIDRSVPDIGYLLKPLPNAAGWSAASVQVVFVGTDTLSGVVGCSSAVVVAEGKGQKIPGSCHDAAGNISYATATVNIDLVPPLVSAERTPAANAAGWNNTPVRAIFAGTDALSGIASCSSEELFRDEGYNQAGSGYCLDYAGWSSTAAFTVSVDTTPPALSYVAEPAPNAAGWNNSDVAIKFTCSDALSGVKSCPVDMALSSEGINLSTSVMAVDYADNAKAVRVEGLKIDKTSPVSTATLSGATSGGWYSSEVNINLAAADGLAGVSRMWYSLDGVAHLEYLGPITVSADGRHTLNYYAEDKAGNLEAERSLQFAIDTAKPVVDYLLEPTPNAAGWNNGAVAVVFRGTDTLSGIAECSSSTGSAEVEKQSVFGWCRDIAGNVAYSTAIVSLDITGPGVAAAQSPGPNSKGWNNTAVEVSFTGSDVLSGMAYCVGSKIINIEGAGQIVSGYCLDYAGNSSTASISLNVDFTAPVVIVASPAAGGSYVAGKGEINVGFVVADNLDQSPSVSALLVQALDKGTPRGERPASVNVINAQALDPMALDDGLWRLEVVAVDAADNSTRTVSGVFEVVHDTIAPQTTLNIGEPKFSGDAFFINSATPLLLSATDDMLLAGDRQGVGVEFTYASIDGGAAAVVAGPLNILGEGLHTLAYHSVDKAGNAEPAKTAAFSVDNSAPEAEHTITGPVFQGGQLYISTSAMIALSAVEPPSSGAASGLAAIFVADSTDVYVAYAGAFTAAEGAHVYGYFAKDWLGNASQVKTLALVADGIPPATELAFSLAPSTETANRLTISSDTYIWLAGTDAHSGIAAITYSIDGSTPAVFASSFTLAPGPHSVAWWSVDNVGNAEPARTAAIQVRGQTGLAEVTLNFSPQVINLKSEGKYVEARLAVSSAAGAGFDEETIRITKINSVALSAPIYAVDGPARGQSDCGKDGGGKDRDKCGNKNKEKLFSVTVKFDRQALIAVLPTDAVSVVAVEGSFEDDAAFIAEDSLRVINPGRIRKGHGGKWKHRSRACVEIGSKTLKEDVDINVLTVAERFADRLERDKKASAKGLARRGEPFEFGPEGTVFEEPVEISLPYENYDPKKEKLQVAYWNPSSKDWEPLASTLDTTEKVVKAKVRHFSLYQVVVSTIAEAKIVRPAWEQPGVGVQDAGPSAAFVPGEVYVYPNPAKGGAVPIFHIECGIADSVDIKVYTVSGREAHEATLTGMPAVIDQRYAYEYAWRGHIPSGVYLYFIEARKGGQKIKKTGKFSVVR